MFFGHLPSFVASAFVSFLVLAPSVSAGPVAFNDVLRARQNQISVSGVTGGCAASKEYRELVGGGAKCTPTRTSEDARVGSERSPLLLPARRY